MQETITTTPDDELPPSRPRRFRLIALGLVLTLFVPFAYVAYRNIADSISDPDPAPGFPEPDFSLTDEEAIARFQELNEVRVRAYETADIKLVSDFAAPGQFKDEVLSELRRLKKDNVTASLLLETEGVDISSNDPNRIELRESVIFDIRFLNESGKDVTKRSGRERFVVDWTLEYTDQGWLIAESTVVEAKPLG